MLERCQGKVSGALDVSLGERARVYLIDIIGTHDLGVGVHENGTIAQDPQFLERILKVKPEAQQELRDRARVDLKEHLKNYRCPNCACVNALTSSFSSYYYYSVADVYFFVAPLASSAFSF